MTARLNRQHACRSAMAAIVYITPFRNTDNPYIERQKALLAELGFEVRPLSLRALLAGRCSGLLSRRNIVLVHWLESRVFELGVPERGISPLGATSFASYLIVLAVSRARVVYFVHNHSVHDVKPRYAGLSRAMIGLLRAVADSRVVHDPSCARRYEAAYLPHPLSSARNPPAGSPPPSADRPIRYAIMGALRPYKGIDGLLRAWPRGVELLIAGPGEPSYVALLARLIEARGLCEWVKLDARFLSESEFSEVMRRQDVLILPHLPNANLVSGAFFEAIGAAKVILARQTPFLAWAKTRFPCVLCFEADREIPDKLAQIAAAWPALRLLDSAAAAAHEFGATACRDAYRRFLAADDSACSPVPTAKSSTNTRSSEVRSA
jgi:beta-1,4-mannosyltransferase